MSKDEQIPPTGAQPRTGKTPKRWFKPNTSGPGWHPDSWQGWLITGLIVAAIVTFVALFRSGVL
ncbi:hypothetical protein QO003_003814 [Arthrobacter silviterrae]|uniref:DUF2631 domain-containing protein n=1 Tax=Arthrobacter silviterrae TaxID=2026658 RepID=A0ABX0DC90_9MICC|nr:hypothetical protein [Arthrobacter silviterrae]MDQ0279511.1 hypothetical protein [Arthrobacter silviterrae]NGN82010.1 hypothetical protein [Arthrobacter silviterrae]